MMRNLYRVGCLACLHQSSHGPVHVGSPWTCQAGRQSLSNQLMVEREGAGSLIQEQGLNTGLQVGK